MSSQSLEELQTAVDELIQQYQELQKRNDRLTKTHERWMAERRNTLRRFEQVEKCIDSSLQHLESLDLNQNST